MKITEKRIALPIICLMELSSLCASASTNDFNEGKSRKNRDERNLKNAPFKIFFHIGIQYVVNVGRNEFWWKFYEVSIGRQCNGIFSLMKMISSFFWEFPTVTLVQVVLYCQVLLDYFSLNDLLFYSIPLSKCKKTVSVHWRHFQKKHLISERNYIF